MKQLLTLILLCISFAAPAQSSALSYLKKYNGKYPSGVKLLDSPPLNARIKKMLGKKYTLFRKNIGIENPIEINDDVLFACGCFPHMCSEEESAIFIVFPTGNILIAIIHNYEYTLYTEKPVKQGQYPKRYLQWLDDHGFK